MARKEHTREIDGRTVKFGCDPVKKEIDIPNVQGAVDANDLVQAIAQEFAAATGPDYPLGECTNGASGRDLCMAPGWKIRKVQRNRVTNPGEGSDFA